LDLCKRERDKVPEGKEYNVRPTQLMTIMERDKGEMNIILCFGTWREEHTYVKLPKRERDSTQRSH
jgi:hypothetical protein